MTFQHNLCKARDKPFTAPSTTKADADGCKDVRDYFARGFGALNIIIQMLTVSADSQAGRRLSSTRERGLLKRPFRYRRSVRREKIRVGRVMPYLKEEIEIQLELYSLNLQ